MSALAQTMFFLGVGPFLDDYHCVLGGAELLAAELLGPGHDAVVDHLLHGGAKSHLPGKSPLVDGQGGAGVLHVVGWGAVLEVAEIRSLGVLRIKTALSSTSCSAAPTEPEQPWV